MKTKEEIFIEQINLKRREAYHELFRRFYRSLVIFALKYIDEQGEAEDIVQELFVSVWEKEEKFMSYACFRVFLYNAVRNTCLNRIKHKKVEEKYAAYRQLHPENPELDDYDIMEAQRYKQKKLRQFNEEELAEVFESSEKHRFRQLDESDGTLYAYDSIKTLDLQGGFSNDDDPADL